VQAMHRMLFFSTRHPPLKKTKKRILSLLQTHARVLFSGGPGALDLLS